MATQRRKKQAGLRGAWLMVWVIAALAAMTTTASARPSHVRPNCASVHVEFVPRFEDDEGDGTGTLTVVQESRDSVSATVPFEAVGTVDVELTPGHTWGVNATNSPNLSIGLTEPEYYVNGTAVCDSTDSFFS